MSVRAYISSTDKVEEKKDNYMKIVRYESIEPLFTLGKTSELLELFDSEGFNCLNIDGIGELEISKEGYKDFIRNNSTRNWPKYDKMILKKIDDYFIDDTNEFLILKCY